MSRLLFLRPLLAQGAEGTLKGHWRPKALEVRKITLGVKGPRTQSSDPRTMKAKATKQQDQNDDAHQKNKIKTSNSITLSLSRGNWSFVIFVDLWFFFSLVFFVVDLFSFSFDHPPRSLEEANQNGAASAQRQPGSRKQSSRPSFEWVTLGIFVGFFVIESQTQLIQKVHVMFVFLFFCLLYFCLVYFCLLRFIVFCARAQLVLGGCLRSHLAYTRPPVFFACLSWP